jgi:CubicO group peptidase (beta-lactamase class C family)
MLSRDRGSSDMLRAIIGLVLCVALGAPAAMSQSLPAPSIAAIDQAMNRAVDTGWVPGGVVAVARGGKVVFEKGYGRANLETGTPANPDTVFRIGSLTKQFTAAAMLLLAQDGRLRIDDPVGKYLSEFPRDDSTTIRQLLTHTSGIADYVGRAFQRETPFDHKTDQLVAYVLTANPLHTFPPGTQWQYSSSNYALAGAIVERVSGMSLGAFLKARIFDPLGMMSTALDDSRDTVPHRASGYDRTPSGFANARAISMTVPFAAGGMRSTARDLLVWTDALTHGRVLDSDSYRVMTTPVRLNDGSLPLQVSPDGVRHPVSYGLGLFIGTDATHPDLWHEGAIDGFTSHLGHFGRSGVDVAVLLNTPPNDHLPISGIVAALSEEAVQAEATSVQPKP